MSKGKKINVKYVNILLILKTMKKIKKRMQINMLGPGEKEKINQKKKWY